MAGLPRSPFDPIEEFQGEYRCIYADLRNANPGQSSGPLEHGIEASDLPLRRCANWRYDQRQHGK